MKRLKADSTLHIPSFCGIPTLRNSIAKEGAIAMDTCNNKFYKWTNANGWSEVSGGGGASQDLASVLNVGNKGYKNIEILTTNGSNNNVIVSAKDNGGLPKLSLNDSLNQSITLQTQTKYELPAIIFNKNSDNQTLLFNGGSLGNVYLPDQRYDLPNSVEDTLATLRNIRNASFDTTSLSNRINLKLNISDTNSMLQNYATQTLVGTKANSSTLISTTAPLSGGGDLSVNRTLSISQANNTTNGYLSSIDWNNFNNKGNGTVRSVATGYGLSGGTITTSGTISVDSATLSNKYLRISDTANKWVNNVTRELGKDSIIYYIGSNRYAIKDSVGTGGSSQNGRFGNDTATIVMAKVHNDAGVQLTNGKVVYLGTSGTSSDVPSVRLANNKADSTSANTFGFVSGTINVNDTGWIILSGKIEKLNTSAFLNGDIIYLDSISGNWTKSKPVAPYHMVYLGVVVKANAGNGSIFVKCQNGYEMDEIHDVLISSKVNNNIIVYSDTQKVWKNRSIYSVVDTVNTIATKSNVALKVNISDTATMLSNYAKTSAVNLKVNISDTANMLSNYAKTSAVNLKVNISDTANMLSNYAKTSVVNTKANSSTTISTSAPLSGGGDLSANRTLSISQATTSTNGYLSSTDWNTFNGKQNALTNPITGTGTSGTISKFTGTSTIGDATVDVDYLQQDMSLIAYQAMGSTIKGYTLTVPNPNNVTATASIGGGVISYIAVYIPKTVTVTGVRWYNATNAVGASTSYNGVGLYSVSGATLTLIASSTDDATCWTQGANSWRSKAFSSTQSISRGIYYIAILANYATTAPFVGIGTAATNVAVKTFDFTNSLRFNATTNNTTFPSSLNASSFNANASNVAVYLY